MLDLNNTNVYVTTALYKVIYKQQFDFFFFL